MSMPELREAWKQWCAFADALSITNAVDADCMALHGRLFKLCAKHPLKPKHLRKVRDEVRKTLDPWLGGKGKATKSDLDRLGAATRVCFSAWDTLFGLDPVRTDYGSELSREAERVGMPEWEESIWQSPYFDGEFDPLAALKAESRESALATISALFGIAQNEKGERLWKWLRRKVSIRYLADTLDAASVLGEAAREGVLTTANVGQVRLGEVVPILADFCEGFALRCLIHLNTDAPVRVPATASASGKPVRRAESAIYKRTPPDPLPIEPFFRKLKGAEPFLHAIAEEPLEDVHRLALADWLDEHGHSARAEFIRIQCAQSALPWFHPMRDHDQVQIKAILEANESEWTRGLEYGGEKLFPRPEGRYVEETSCFRRGMLEYAEIDSEEDIAALPEAMKQADLRSLSMSGLQNEDAFEVVTSAWLARLSSLSLYLGWSYQGEEVAKTLAAQESLRGLTHLHLDTSLNESGQITLFENLQMRALSNLIIDDYRVSPGSIAALTQRPWFRNMRELQFARLDASSLRALVSAENVAGLTSLKLPSSSITAQSIETLSNSPHLANLTTLGLNGNRFGNAGIRHLVKSPFVKNLTAIDLGWTSLKAEGLRHLLESDRWSKLQVLDLSNNDFDDDAIAALAAGGESPALTALSLAWTELTESRMTKLANAPILRHLTALNLSQKEMDDATARALLASQELTKLVHLDLRQAQLGEAVKAALKKRWPHVLL